MVPPLHPCHKKEPWRVRRAGPGGSAGPVLEGLQLSISSVLLSCSFNVSVTRTLFVTQTFLKLGIAPLATSRTEPPVHHYFQNILSDCSPYSEYFWRFPASLNLWRWTVPLWPSVFSCILYQSQSLEWHGQSVSPFHSSRKSEVISSPHQ